MPEFKSWRSYWEFERTVIQRTRYVYGPEVKLFLDTVRQTAEKRIEVLPPEMLLWRAQLGNDWEPINQDGEHIGDAPAPYSPKRMKPLTECATEGRANPKQILCLYLATNRDTALAEVRPWVESFISVGQFKTIRELRIVNCTTDRQGSHVYWKEPSAEEREESVWAHIDEAFARPGGRTDVVADYVPTQIIAELFKIQGLDGIAYRSSLSAGHNIVLFDIDAAEMINCFLFQVKSMRFEFHESANPYFIRKHYDKDKPSE